MREVGRSLSLRFLATEADIFPLLEAFESVGDYFLEWGRFLWWYKPVSVILTFDPVVLGSGLLPSSECERVGGQWIYNVEVCHRGPIPVGAIQEVIMVQADGPAKGQFAVRPLRGEQS